MLLENFTTIIVVFERISHFTFRSLLQRIRPNELRAEALQKLKIQTKWLELRPKYKDKANKLSFKENKAHNHIKEKPLI